MGIIIRQGFKTSLVSFLGVFIGAVNVLWFFPKFLEPEEIGIINLLESTALLFASLGSLGVFSISDRFAPRFKEISKKHNGYFIFLSTYLFVGYLLFSCVFLVFKNFWISFYLKEAPEAIQYFYYILPFTLVMMYQSLFESYSRIHLRITVPTLFREVILKLLIISSVVAYSLAYFAFEMLLAMRITAYALVAIGVLLYIRNLKILFLQANFAFITRKLLKEIIIYGLFIVLGGASTLIVVKVDVLMIPAMLGTKELGIYTIAYFMGTIIEVPRRALSQISTPIIAQAWADNNLAKIKDIYQKSALNQLIIGALLLLGIWCNVDSIFSLIPNGNIYETGKYVILFIGLTRLIDMATGINNEILLQSKYYKFNLLAVVFLAILSVFTNLIFIPIYGINGAAGATLLSFCVFNLMKFIFLWLKFRMQPFSWRTPAVIFLAILTYWIQQFIPIFDSTLTYVFVKSAFITLFYGLFILLLNISPDLNNLLRVLLRRLRESFK